MPTIKEEISRVKELMGIIKEQDKPVSTQKDKKTPPPIDEEIMHGMQGGYPDDSDGDNSYDFVSKGALGSQTELEDEGFTEPETNYSKIKPGYDFDSEGPTDSYMDPEEDYGMELSYELGEQEEGTESGESDDAAGAGTASMGIWDSGVARGIANQLANTKWADSYQPSRGKSNPLW